MVISSEFTSGLFTNGFTNKILFFYVISSGFSCEFTSGYASGLSQNECRDNRN